MNLKRDNWTNDEVIELLKGCECPSLPVSLDDPNFSLLQAIYLFYDMRADPKKSAGAKALDMDTGRVVCVGPKLPQ